MENLPRKSCRQEHSNKPSEPVHDKDMMDVKPLIGITLHEKAKPGAKYAKHRR